MKKFYSSILVLILAVSISAQYQKPVSNTSIPEFKLGEPITHGNLTLIPLFAKHNPSPNFITLNEGLKNKTVIVQEKGTGEVPTLRVTNRSGRPLLLLAGEILQGGYQDRIVHEDCIVAGDARPVDIRVFCVEQGRWSGGQAFTTPQHPQGVKAKNEEVSIADGAIAMPSVREAAQVTSDQGKVWNAVSKARDEKIGEPDEVRQIRGLEFATSADSSTNGVLRYDGSGRIQNSPLTTDGSGNITVTGGSSSTITLSSSTTMTGMISDEISTSSTRTHDTGTLVKIYTDPKLAQELRDYKSLVLSVLSEEASGVVVVVAGEVVMTEIFSSPSLFRRYMPKLLQSYFLEARATKKDAKEISYISVWNSLRPVMGTYIIKGREGVYKLTERRGETLAASFDLEAPDKRVHYSRFN